ncbi:MAG TPA: hypothetical protein VL137_09345 [Polyangiaceae bacterium]|jgi:hypothetical protein|nr:hypothetical protein [Polyangiaceae bacterium]
MTRSARALAALFPIALALAWGCSSGTTVLGQQLPAPTVAGVSTAGTSGSTPHVADASAGFGFDRDGGVPRDLCRNKHCGQLCGSATGEGPDGYRFCDRRGDCEPGLPQCTDVPGCITATDCRNNAPTLPFENCFQCADSSVSCSDVQCVSGMCQVVPAACNTGVVHCADDSGCPTPPQSMCETCMDRLSCPTSHCVFGQCTVIVPTCDAYWPCRGRQCGHFCSLCPPDDPTCDQGLNAGTCNALGECVLGTDTFCR